MMRHLVRGAAVLLFLSLAALSLLLEEIRFVAAGAAVAGLVELALALRRRRGSRAAQDRSRVSNAQVSCLERDGTLSVTLVGEKPGRGAAPYVLLSRKLGAGRDAAAAPHEDSPYLELSGRKWSVHGGIRDAYLSPQCLCLTLDPRGAQALAASEVRVTLPSGNDQRRLERALGRILRGVPFTSERSLPPSVPVHEE